MALYEYRCQPCQARFESIRTFDQSHEAECPHCGTLSQEKLLSAFAVAGRGDLRESTQHGCHDCHVPPASSSKSHACGPGHCG